MGALTGIAEDNASSEESGGLEPDKAGKEGFPKPAEGKSKPEGRKTKEGGRKIQILSFCEPCLFNGLHRPPGLFSFLASPGRTR
jgi:hypothetical protein